MGDKKREPLQEEEEEEVLLKEVKCWRMAVLVRGREEDGDWEGRRDRRMK